MDDMHTERLRSPSRLYQSSASILLLGFEGSGRKTLGIIAALSLKRQYVDFGRYFAQMTGQSLSEFIASRDLAALKAEVTKVLEHLLENHNLNCVIGGLPQLCVRYQQDLLLSFVRTNPVIYVRRMKEKLDLGSIKVDKLYHTLDKCYSACSSFDYYNLDTESALERSTLRLKVVETNFTRFVRSVLGLLPRHTFPKDHFSPSYTYALQISEEQIYEGFDFKSLECGADAINLIVKPATCISAHEQIVKRLSLLRHHTPLPIIIDFIANSTEASVYLFALQSALRVVPDAITIDLATGKDIIALINSIRGSVNIIGTYHHDEAWADFRNSPSLFRLQAIAANVALHSLRLTANARSHADNVDCFEFAYSMKRAYNIPITAYNIGRGGRTSICLNQILSPVVLSSEHPCGITIQQARSALRSSYILESKKFAIFGSSISYSLAPAMHNAAYRICGLPHSFNIQQSDNFENIHNFLTDSEYGGLAITMPFKAQALSILDVVDPEAQKIGAVNTIVIERQHDSQVLKGFNTDHIGIRECLVNNLSPANSIRSGSTALVVGAGGVARAAIYALQTLGVGNVCIWNRTHRRARTLTEELRSATCNLKALQSTDTWPEGIEQPTVIISTIPAHRVGDTPAHELNIPEGWLLSNSGGTFVELAYKPMLTRFIAQMRQVHGWIVVDGWRVLLAQGVAQFELFTGTSAPSQTMEDALQEQYMSATTTSLPTL